MNTDKDFANFLNYCTRGNEAATGFLLLITNVAHFFDDLYDGDNPVDKPTLVKQMWALLVELPRNDFYRQFFWELQPLITNALNNWTVANRLEANPKDATDLRVAFVIRSSYADLIQQTALLCGGPEWAAQVGTEVRRKAHAEPWDQYIKSVEVSHGAVQPAEAAGS